MFGRQKTGSVVCASCGYLVGVNDDKCYHCGRRNPGLWGFAPALRRLGNDLGFVPFMTGTCGLLYVLTLFASRGDIDMGPHFGFLGPNEQSLVLFGASGYWPMFVAGHWWTVLSAGWLHGSLAHIAFNVLWIRQLAPAIGELYGPGRMVIIYTVAGVLGFAASSLAFLVGIPIPFLRGGYLTVGASASIFGLLGALVYYGRRSGSRHIHGTAMNWVFIAGIVGFILPGIDNWAHAGGFAGGYLMGRWLDPLTPERVNHLAIAVACLEATVVAILVSLVIWLTRAFAM
jgi:rhomboid protease GluP